MTSNAPTVWPQKLAPKGQDLEVTPATLTDGLSQPRRESACCPQVEWKAGPQGKGVVLSVTWLVRSTWGGAFSPWLYPGAIFTQLQSKTVPKWIPFQCLWEVWWGGGGRETFVYIFKNCLASPFATCQYQQALCLNVYALSWRRQYVTMSTFLILEVESFSSFYGMSWFATLYNLCKIFLYKTIFKIWMALASVVFFNFLKQLILSPVLCFHRVFCSLGRATASWWPIMAVSL